ncbi:hypothetical protein BaRGS_00016710, partial [Batillaria attramentaria]
SFTAPPRSGVLFRYLFAASARRPNVANEMNASRLPAGPSAHRDPILQSTSSVCACATRPFSTSMTKERVSTCQQWAVDVAPFLSLPPAERSFRMLLNYQPVAGDTAPESRYRQARCSRPRSRIRPGGPSLNLEAQVRSDVPVCSSDPET